MKQEYDNILFLNQKHYRSFLKGCEIFEKEGVSAFGSYKAIYTKKHLISLSFLDKKEESAFEKSEHKKKQDITNFCLEKSGLPTHFIIAGTEFQTNVWKALLNIPAGKVLSYSELAQKISKPNSVRAVANAVASNKIAFFIPCHRVICKDGALGGYKWGIQIKRKILGYETKAAQICS